MNVEPPPQTLAQRAVDDVPDARATRYRAGRSACSWSSSVICIGSYALGVAALTDQGRILWIVLGGVFVVIGIGAVVLAITRLWLVKRSAVVARRRVPAAARR